LKLGIYLNDWKPTSGGAFSFQDSIVHSLAKSEYPHEYHIFCHEGMAEIKELGFLSVLPIKDNPWKTKSKLKKGYRAGKTFIHSLLRSEEKSKFKALVRKHEIDLLWYLSPVFEEVDIPYIYTVWDLEHRSQPYFPEVGAPQEWRNRESMFSSMICRAAFVLTGTEQGKNNIMKYYGINGGRVRVLPMPAPRIISAENSDHILPLELSKRPYLLYPSQFWAHKNHITLLLAMKVLKDMQVIDIGAIFTGSDQGNMPYVRRAIEDLELVENITLLGFVERQMLVSLYRNAFALVYPSYFGPDNLPPLEAFALGCPVIAANIPGSEEQLGDAALLVDPGDETAMAQAILRLRDEPGLRDTLVKRGADRATAWSADDYVNQVMELAKTFETIRRCWGHE
jgi:glycosyltransferase involved in cell wall biosynthesis